jgi:hypothetical protein
MRTPYYSLVAVLGLVALAAAGGDPPKADAEHIARLVKQLGSDNFDEREKATRELEEIGPPALAALRAAGKDGAEVKARAAGLIERIERKAQSGSSLAPTRVKLAFKDAPLAEALAEFNKKSGYAVRLHDPDQKLKGRTVTLATEEITFWEALDRFCEQAGLVEPPPRVALARGGAQTIELIDGKPRAVPTSYSGAVRIRTVKEGPGGGRGAAATQEEGPTVWLELRCEPRLQLLSLESASVTRATDDKGQAVIAAGETPEQGRRGGAGPAPGGFPGSAAAAVQGRQTSFGATHYHPIPLKAAGKDARTLKELAGTVNAEVLGAGEPYIVADKITKAAGETFKGKSGGYLRINDVKEEDGRLTVRFEQEQPSGMMAANVLTALPPPARGSGPLGGIVPAPGVSLVDELGRIIPQSGGAAVKAHFGPGKPLVLEYTQEYSLEKDQKPAKLVYSTSKVAMIDIPFAFKDVPLR